MNFTSSFPIPSGHEFMMKRASKIMDNPALPLKEAHELSDSEKWAICFFAKVPMRMERGDTPSEIKMVTDCKVGIQKIDGKFHVMIQQATTTSSVSPSSDSTTKQDREGSSQPNS